MTRRKSLKTITHERMPDTVQWLRNNHKATTQSPKA